MKKVLVLLLVLIFTSCGTLKKFERSSSDIVKTENKEVKRDSSSVIEKNGAINDEFKVSVPKVETADKDFNEKCTKIIDQLLKQVNTQKKSGNNNYKLYYNLEKRLLELQIQVAETQNQTNSTNTKEVNEKTYEERTDEYISKKVSRIPWWLYALVAFWFLPQILERLTMFNPLLSKLFKN